MIIIMTLLFFLLYIDAPPTPILSNVSVTGWESTSLVDIVNITIKLNTQFGFDNSVNLYHYVSATSLSGDNHSNITCLSSCRPNELCVCTGALARSGVNVTISAVNCKDQESLPLVIKIKSSIMLTCLTIIKLVCSMN